MLVSKQSRRMALEEKNKKVKALIVDDDLLSVTRLGLIFQGIGVDFEFVFDGIEARRRIKSGDIDLIFLDWDMPVIGGADSLKGLDSYLKTQDLDQKVPFVLYTGYELEGIELPEVDSLECLGHIDKNFNSADLIKLVNRFTHLDK